MMKSAIELPLKEEELVEIVGKAKDWALLHGVGMRLRDSYDEDAISFAPFTLLPSAMKIKDFEEAIAVQQPMSELMHKVAHNHQFLEASLKTTIEIDDFTKKLYNIYLQVRKEGIAQEFSLGIFRSDYMYDNTTNSMKQVEFNTIASSFGGLCTQVSVLHSFILRELGKEDLLKSLPENNALKGICSGIVHAWDIYNNKRAVVMFLVEETTYNICDQRYMEFEIKRLQPQIQVIRRKFSQLIDARLGPAKELILGDGKEIAVVYMRTGYSPDQYKGEQDWQIRLLMERSLAIKCPSIQYHLAGTKKIQQVLSSPGAVEQFITNPIEANKIRKLFTDLFSFDIGSGGETSYKMALKNPQEFVLKPQREGGGNNTYGTDILPLLNSMTPEERQSFILMRLIKTVPTKNIIVARQKQCLVSDIVSELGVFSYVIGSATEVVAIKTSGHMLRSKHSSSSEGGVASGYGALDSPFLVQ